MCDREENGEVEKNGEAALFMRNLRGTATLEHCHNLIFLPSTDINDNTHTPHTCHLLSPLTCKGYECTEYV